MKFKIFIVSVFLIFTLLAGNVIAQNKVVVIPLMEEAPPRAPTDPIPDPIPSRDDYNVEGDIVIDRVTRLVWLRSGSAHGSYAGGLEFCNNRNINGLNRFRLPTVHELMTIVDYDVSGFINYDVFTNNSRTEYWTSTQAASNDYSVWTINFGNGQVSITDTQGQEVDANIRCVMGQTVTYGKFKDYNDGTLTDLSTGLMWQQQENSSTLSWDDAIDYCSDLELGNHKDWRLPNIKELHSIVDTKLNAPAAEYFAFPEIVEDIFWSATTDSDLLSNAWWVLFTDGSTGQSSKEETIGYVRCVR